jgi:hypothetical protein
MIFDYVLSILKLSGEICKGDPGLVISYFDKLYSFETCILAFSNDKLSSNLRSVFLDLFVDSYLSFDSRY